MSEKRERFTELETSNKPSKKIKPNQEKSEDKDSLEKDGQISFVRDDATKQKDKANTEKEQAKTKDNTTNLFGVNSSSPNIFGNSSKFNFSSSGNFSNGVGIFGKSQGNSNSIFQSKQKKEGQNNDEKKPLVFGNGSLFGTSQSLFGNSNKPAPLFQNEGEENDENSAELQKQQNMQADPSKSKGKYKYQDYGSILFAKKCLKLKKHNGELLENAEVIVQQNEEKTINRLIIRLKETKKIIQSGILLKQVSEAKMMNGKDENVIISMIVVENQRKERHVIKIQFEKGEYGNEFREVVNKLLK